MLRRLAALGLAETVLIVVALLWAGATKAAEVTCTVKYLSAEHVYLDAGRSQGLAVGLKGRVVRSGTAIAELEIVFVAERSASATVSTQLQDIVVGDSVVFEAVVAPPAAVTAAPTSRQRTRTASGTTGARRSRDKPRLRGSIAIQWDHGEETDDRKLQTDILRLPFRLEARDVWQGFNFHTRGSLRRLERQGFSGSTPSGEWRNRIQEVALVRNGRDQDWHLALGRIGGRVTNAAGPFDGLSVSRRFGGSSRVGLFGGFAPEWGDLGFGTDDHLAGANYHFSRRAASGRMLDVILAGIGRYRSGEISREYATMTTTWRGTGGLSLLQAVEVDFNRGWRKDAGASTVELSSLALTGRYRLNRAVTMNLGYDDREPVRTWETRSLPDSLFQNAGRQGWRAGLRLRPGRRFSVNLSGSLRRDERTDENITSWNARLNAPGLLATGLTVFGGVRGFDGPWLSGWAPSMGVTKAARGGFHVRAEGGYYSYTGNIDNSTRDNTWASLGLDKDLTARVSAAVEYRQDWGDDIAGRRWFLELRHRF